MVIAMHDLLMGMSDSVGVVGVVMVLTAYLLLSAGYWKSDGLKYQIANFISAWLILFSLYFSWNLSSALVEAAWVLISAYGVYRAAVNAKKLA
jgi:hypothetical protein